MSKGRRSAADATRAVRPLDPAEIQRVKSEVTGEAREVKTSQLPMLSIRAHPDIQQGIRRALADRMVTRAEPRTVQDIVTAAVREWLKANGYA